MNINRTLTIALAAMLAQASVASAQDLFQVKMNIKGNTDDGSRTKLKDLDLVRACVGDLSNKQARKDYALAYNATDDVIQVVRTSTGEAQCNVLEFYGGNAVSDDRQSQRLTYVFLPGQTDAVGTAIITEKAGNNSNEDRARISGVMQIALPQGVWLGEQNNSSTARSSAQSENSRFYSLQGAQETQTGGTIYEIRFNANKRITADAVPAPGGNPGDGGGDNQNGNGLQARDRDFLQNAASANAAEIQMGQLFVSRGETQAVRDYGQMLIDDHTAALAAVVSLAAQKGLTVSVEATPSQQNALERLQNASDADFDRLARTRAIEAHQQAIQLHETERKRGNDADVRALAEQQLPVLREHLEQARSLPNGSTNQNSN